LRRVLRSVFLLLVLLTAAAEDAAVPPPDPPKLEAIQLAAPRTDAGMPLMKALKERRSTRSYAETALTDRQLSELLWAANGVNRDDGKRTAPAALNRQAVDLYVVLPGGTYLFDALAHRLEPVKAGDFRKATGGQEFAARAALALVWVADLAKLSDLGERARSVTETQKIRWALIAAGAQSQNAALYCASEGLGNVVRGSIDPDAFAAAVPLRPEQVVLFAQSVGVPGPVPLAR